MLGHMTNQLTSIVSNGSLCQFTHQLAVGNVDTAKNLQEVISIDISEVS
jgi:hypothetical protein